MDRICLSQPKARTHLVEGLGYTPEEADDRLAKLRIAAIMNGVRYYYVDELPARAPAG